MNKLASYAVLAAAALFGTNPGSAWSEETTSNESNAAAAQAPAPAGAVAPPAYAQPWQPVPRWPVPQPFYGYYPPRYPAGGHYPGFTAAAPAARVNPLSAELKQTQEQLSAKSSELDTANATLEQQHQLINSHQALNQRLVAERDQLLAELAERGEDLAVLQSELQAATQALAQARSMARAAGEALGAARVQVGMHRDELTRLEAELQNQETALQGEPQPPTE